LEIEVPVNTTATVYIPATDPGLVRENGLALSNLKDVQIVGSDKEYVQVAIGSGSYRFEVEKKK
jgi:alpha-L-rhamnosidase